LPKNIALAFGLKIETHAGRIPKEILDFLRSAGGHSLIIKGEAGTGKTTLALQIVEELMEEEANYYLSSRVSDEALYRQFPWLKEKSRRDSILRASKAFLKRTRPPHAKEAESVPKDATLRAAMELLKVLAKSETVATVVRSELQKLEGQIESGELGEEESERYGAEFVDGSIILDLGVLLPELELAYDLAESNLPKKTLVVIDSIDGLSEKYGILSNRIINTLQKDLVDHSSTNIIYVLESGGKTNLDYLGDGVVVLRNEERRGRRVRHLIIEKMRGSRIEKWRYLFTLADGRMKTFEQTQVMIPEVMKRHSPVEDPSDSTVSTGIADFDRVIGGLPKGGLVFFEFGPDIPQEVIECIELTIVADFISKKRGVVWYPLRSLNYPTLDGQINMLVSKDKISKCLKVLDASGIDAGYPFVSIIEGNDASNDLRWDSLSYLLSNASKPFISILGYDAMESQYGNDVFRNTHAFIDTMRREGNIVLAEATEVSTSFAALAHRSQLHIQIESIDGTVMFCGIKPYTPYYGIEFEITEGLPRVELIPMV
jgi:KaiC/GvpD/RAD55 family RecA-like ATPase